jgi:hypothetical protein
MPYSDVAQPYEYKALSGDVTTGSNNYVSSKQGSALISKPLPIAREACRPQDQNNDEWIEAWDNA